MGYCSFSVCVLFLFYCLGDGLFSRFDLNGYGVLFCLFCLT